MGRRVVILGRKDDEILRCYFEEVGVVDFRKHAEIVGFGRDVKKIT